MRLENVEWDYFDRYENIVDKYMPWYDEGDTLASQRVTAVNKLVYKWYNDGDVFDNTYCMEGWANDLSSYANWLAKYMNVDSILNRISECYTDAEYEHILKDLADTILNEDKLAELAKVKRQGSIYKCEGKYEFNERYDDKWDY